MKQKLTAKGTFEALYLNSIKALENAGFQKIKSEQNKCTIYALNGVLQISLFFQQVDNKVVINLEGDPECLNSYKQSLKAVFKKEQRNASVPQPPSSSNESETEKSKSESVQTSGYYTNEYPLSVDKAKYNNGIITSLDHWYYSNWFIGLALSIGAAGSIFLLGIPLFIVGIVFLIKKDLVEREIKKIDYSKYIQALSRLDDINAQIANHSVIQDQFIRQAKERANKTYEQTFNQNQSILIERQSELKNLNRKIKEQSKIIIDPLRIVYKPEHVLSFDTETTGLTQSDEILQLSITDWNENVVFNEMFKPAKQSSWEMASRVNNIYPNDVKDKPSFQSRLNVINKVLKNADVLIGYNTPFDLMMLKCNGIDLDPETNGVMVIDVMKHAADVYGVYSPKYHHKKYIKLTAAVSKSRTSKPDLGDFHNSLYDALCTLRLYKKLNKLKHIPDEQFLKVQ